MTHLIAGLIFVALGAWGIITWWADFGAVLRGMIPIMFVLAGLAGIGAGFRKTRHQGETEDDLSEAQDAGAIEYPEQNRMAG